MNVNVNFKWFFSVVFAIAIQVLFLRDIAIANVAFCFIYIWFLVKAPMQTNTWILLVGSMFVGWLIDIFYNTHGMHAFACVLVAWLRPVYFRILTPANGYDERSSISLAEMKWLWFFPYLFLMLMSHHLLLFILEAGDWTLLGFSLLKALSSSLLGMAVFGILEFFNRHE
ncbi:MAG: hypothetical protein RI981_1268 [Bacteroidota bacterium]|jgi:hypothetical protein